MCAGDDALRLGDAAPNGSAERARKQEAASAHYRKAASLASSAAMKVVALNQVVAANDRQHLNRPKEMETALSEIIMLMPDDLAPVFQLARVLEDEQLIDEAERMLVDARHSAPDSPEPSRMLAQFYARLVTGFRKVEPQEEPPRASSPGEPDADGVYQIGGSLSGPARDDVPHYPPDAQAAGIRGAVIVEITIDTSGTVVDTKVVRSVPLLDEEAVRTVRNWHYAPTMVNGQPVPVRMNVTVNFTLPATTPSSSPPRR
jgi:TonB family protein